LVRDSFNKYALDRASFEMKCPKEKIEIVGLNKPLDANAEAGVQVGATGCGTRVVYVLAMGAVWVVDSASSEQPREGTKQQPVD
jgi:hypothetical protein